MKFLDDKRLLYHIQLPAIAGAISGLFVHWNIFQTISFCVSLVLLTHWLSSYFDKNSYEILNNRLFGTILLAVFALVYFAGFYLMPEGINTGAFYHDITNDATDYFLGDIHPRLISMIIVLLPLGPYIIHLICGCIVGDKDQGA